MLDRNTQKNESMPEGMMGKEKQRSGSPASAQKPRTCRAVGRPKKRWEDEINDFLRPEETYETKGNDVRNNDTWIKIAKNQIGWSNMENVFAMTAAASLGDRRQRRRWVDQHDENP